VSRSSLLAVTLFSIVSPTPAQTTNADLSPEAQEYLERALSIMESQSLNSATIDWALVRANAYAAAAGARSSRDTYPAIRLALRALGDNHSFFREPTSAGPASTVLSSSYTRPTSHRIDDQIAYIHVPAFAAANTTAFAAAIQSAIREADAPAVCGWIVDLRGNGGGNMWPMLQGLRPILGSETPGYFLSPSGSLTPWVIDGTATEQYVLYNPTPPVAVLHDRRTGSSGEAVVIAFRGRARTRTFGEGTSGLSTANRSIPLSDGAMMFLTVAVFVDRLLRKYGAVIEPDEPASPMSPGGIPVNVTEWLEEQLSCAVATYWRASHGHHVGGTSTSTTRADR
jgi:C-terminal processing protease CtpA/Prc